MLLLKLNVLLNKRFLFFLLQSLDSDQSKHLTVICTECWHHISEFHNFQESVLLVQKQYGLMSPTAGALIKSEDDAIQASDLFVISEIAHKKYASFDDEALSPPQHSSNDMVIKREQEESFDNEMVFPDCPSTSKFSQNPKTKPLINSHKSGKSKLTTTKSPVSAYHKGKSLEITQEIESESEDDEDDDDDEDETTESSSGDELSTLPTLENSQLRSVTEYDEFIAKWRATLVCIVCGKVSASFSLLLQHFLEQHPKEKCHILCCARKFYNQKEIVQHIIHHQQMGFKCNKCFKIFSKQHRLQLHMDTVHFGKAAGSEMHRKQMELYGNNNEKAGGRDRPHLCTICGKSFATKYALGKHDIVIHSQNALQYKCTICNKGFMYEKYLDAHMVQHSDTRTNCPYCPKSYKFPTALYAHCKNRHPKEWEERCRNKTQKNNNMV